MMFESGYKQRIIKSRKSARLSQSEMAAILRVSKDRYAKYENRANSKLPPELIVPFCLATGIDEYWLLTGTYRQPSRKAA